MLYYGQNMVKRAIFESHHGLPSTSEAAKRVWAGLLRSVLRSAAKQLRVDRGWARLALLAIKSKNGPVNQQTSTWNGLDGWCLKEHNHGKSEKLKSNGEWFGGSRCKNARHSPEMMMEYYGFALGSVDFMLDGDQNSRW